MSKILQRLREQSGKAQRRVIFPETQDERVQQALRTITADDICCPVILSEKDNLEGCEVFWDLPDAQNQFDRAVWQYTQKRQHKGMTEAKARQVLRDDPLLLSTCLVLTGFVDTGVAGSIATTPDVLRACLQSVGLAPGAKLVSSTFLIDHPMRLMTYGDCGVNPDPNAEELAHIAVDSARTHQVLTGQSAKVALLSFSTLGSAEHSSVDKVREAVTIAKALAPDLAIEGELQADAALIAEIGASKAPRSAVAGAANVLIFPDLNAGNIAYKLSERLGGAEAIGPILQGLAKPWVDLSRGCNSEDIVNAAAIASLLSVASSSHHAHNGS